MADDLTIYDRIAAAVAERREPDLSSFDPADVDAAMRRALTYQGPRASFEHWLAGRVAALSNGTVTLETGAADQPSAADQTGAADRQGDGLVFRVETAGEPFGEPVSIVADGTPVRWPMRNGD